MTTKETKEIEITYAVDQPSQRDYTFSEYLSFKNNDNETANWEFGIRPSQTKIWNQGNTAACTCYSLTHIYNWENILEDETIWVSREQQDPMVLWKRFCAWRNNYVSWYDIQGMALWFKKQLLIEWFVTIPKWTKQIEQMKQALDMWKFISTGSAYWDWANIKKTGIYSVRTDGMFVGHAWAIVDYWDGYFRAVNSYWEDWWPYNGKFKVPFELVSTIYSTLVIIDKDDSGAFAYLQDYKKAQEMLSIAKDLYNRGNNEVKKYFEQIQLGNNIERLYNTNK